MSANLAKALAELDFSASNAELARLKADLEVCYEKAAQVRTEAERLAHEIANWSAPDGETLADAIMAGEDPGAAAQSFPTRDDLRARRDALLSAIPALDDRAHDLRQASEEITRQEQARLLAVLQPYLDGIAERQRTAAKAIVDGHAELAAIGEIVGAPYLPERLPSRQAVERLIGMDRLLPYATTLPVPLPLVQLLEPVTTRCKAVEGKLRRTVPAG